MPRYFTLSESESLLPEVEIVLREAVAHKSVYSAADQKLENIARKIRESGGANLDRGAYLESRARRDSSAVALKAALERIEQLGALVKDLDIGLIDFLSIHQGREVCLCWKLGEERIAFWHSIEEGFRGRKPIDDEFRASQSDSAPGDRAPN